MANPRVNLRMEQLVIGQMTQFWLWTTSAMVRKFWLGPPWAAGLCCLQLWNGRTAIEMLKVAFNKRNEDPYIISKALLDEGQKHLLLKGEIPIDCPVRLIHGELDQDVPWKTSFRLAKSLRSQDVSILFVKGGDHRLSEPQDLDRLCSTLENLLDQY